MKKTFARAIAALDNLVNYFIPPSVAADRDTRNRAHVFLVSHILGPFIGNVVPISIYLLDPAPGYDVAVLAASITLFWVFPFILRAGATYDTLALVSIENLIFCILWSCYFYGGVTSPTLAWVLVIPLLAFFYLGSSSKLRTIVMIMFAVNVAIFSFFYFYAFRNQQQAAGCRDAGARARLHDGSVDLCGDDGALLREDPGIAGRA